MPIDLKPILDAFPNASKDWKRIGLFLMAAQKKAAEMVIAGEDVTVFMAATFELAKAWVPKKPNFWQIISGNFDPFKEARQKARVFAEFWSLDPAFLEAMG